MLDARAPGGGEWREPWPVASESEKREMTVLRSARVSRPRRSAERGSPCGAPIVGRRKGDLPSGFSGTLTLEMINLGPTSILLRPGMSIAQLIIEEVKGIPRPNPSQFQGQTNPEGAPA